MEELTIITATYNRCKTLERLYFSLCNQTDKNFEWIIIDDGSIDNTKEFLSKIGNNTKFNIKCKYQQNSGKHAAINAAIAMAECEYNFIVDSDDALTPDAVMEIRQKIDQYPNEIGYCFRKMLFDGTRLGAEDDSQILIMKPCEAGEKFHADLAYVFSTKAMRLCPFPIIQGEKFVPELLVWNRLSDMGRILYFPNIWIYSCEYLDDGLSKNFNRNLRKNPKGFLLFYKDALRRDKKPVRWMKDLLRIIQCKILFLLKLSCKG